MASTSEMFPNRVTTERVIAGSYDVYVGRLRVGRVQAVRNGWQVTYGDGKDLGTQPRKHDAVTFLVMYAKSPGRWRQ